MLNWLGFSVIAKIISFHSAMDLAVLVEAAELHNVEKDLESLMAAACSLTSVSGCSVRAAYSVKKEPPMTLASSRDRNSKDNQLAMGYLTDPFTGQKIASLQRLGNLNPLNNAVRQSSTTTTTWPRYNTAPHFTGSSGGSFKCQFIECKKKIWLNGFRTARDFKYHNELHRCQWMIRSDKDSSIFSPCDYMPNGSQDMVNHIDDHIDRDLVPAMKCRDRTVYFCPWQCCTSDAYTQKGSSNKSHVHLHIKKHAYLNNTY